MSVVTGIIRRYRHATAPEEGRIRLYPGVEYGEDVKLTGHVDFGSEPFLVHLGSHITIADGVRFITHDGAVRVFRDEEPDLHLYAPIRVSDHVFIGIGATIMPGVVVGDHSIIGAGSVVTKDVPPETVVAGVPARVVKSLADYRAQALERGMRWKAGDYGDEWRAAVKRHALGRAYPMTCRGQDNGGIQDRSDSF